MNSPQITNAAALLGRIFMSAIFISAGYSKIGGYAGSAAYMAKMGVPGALLPLVILTELGGGLLILFGFQTRIAAFLLAGFCLLSGLLFHLSVGDAPNMIQFWKNVAMAGGFLGMVAHGAGAWSVDAQMRK
ncbi:MAG TPA: DoxX family protein [Rhodoblastus sp.]|nr:DoxX family protein [Rhodoblastus sp.]